MHTNDTGPASQTTLPGSKKPSHEMTLVLCQGEVCNAVSSYINEQICSGVRVDRISQQTDGSFQIYARLQQP